MELDRNNIGMKRFILLLVSLIIGTAAASAQDLIVKRNGEEIRARVTAVGTDTISYKLFDEANGVVYTIMKGEVVLIKYENGRNEVITARSSSYDPLLYGTREPVAGIKPGMKYRELKDLYNHKEYVRGLVQHHNPAGAGVGSFFIPGLGQMICGEGWRGTAFLGGCIAANVVSAVGIQQGSEVVYLIGAAASLTAQIWSIVDAVRVAKVKNMYERDLMRTYAVDVDLYPSVDCMRTSSGLVPTAGMTLALKF